MIYMTLKAMLARAKERGYRRLIWYIEPATEAALIDELEQGRSVSKHFRCLMNCEVMSMVQRPKTHRYQVILGAEATEYALGLTHDWQIEEVRYAN